LEAQVLSSETDPAEYAKVRGHLAARFDRGNPATAVTRANSLQGTQYNAESMKTSG